MQRLRNISILLLSPYPTYVSAQGNSIKYYIDRYLENNSEYRKYNFLIIIKLISIFIKSL